MKFKLAAMILVGTSAFLMGQERFDFKVRSYFFAGFTGDSAALEKGMQICEEALKTDPKNAQALVWHGSGVFFEAEQAFQKGDSQNGMALWQRGLKEMSDAVALQPDALAVVIPRGAVLLTASHYAPPQMAQQLIETGVQDFENAYQIQGPDLSKLGTHPRGELMIGLADGYSRLGDQEKARQWFERIEKEMPGTPYAKSAATWLETKSLAPKEAGCLGCHTEK